MATVTIDGTEIEIGEGERLNGIQAARRAGVEIPHYCWHPGLSVVASCRMCLVETGTRNAETGEISMLPKLVPACQTPARDGTIFATQSEKVKHARACVEEDLLINHPIDCPICDKAGECHLQDYYFQYGQRSRRADLRPFTSRRRPVGETVTLFVDRCVMCSRCVRFTREITGSSELMIVARGNQEEIDVLPGFPLANKLSGNVVDLCPVGALGDRDFLYHQRVWFLKRHEGVCTGCSTGCSIFVEENQNHIYRLKPRENPHVNQWWMCDDGRYGFHHVHREDRLTAAERRGDDGYEAIEWHDVPDEVERVFGASRTAACVVSPHLTVEEAYLLCKLIRRRFPQAGLFLGPVPVVGEDETFPSGFTIHAEKCPNRRGVEEVIRHFAGDVATLDDLVDSRDGGLPDLVWLTGGDQQPSIDEATAARFDGVAHLVVQDLFDSPCWHRATLRLPGAAFAEREGSYVNFAGRLQSARWAVRPPQGAWVEGDLYWRLLELPGMYRARTVLDEVAQQIPCFAPAAGTVAAEGVELDVSETVRSE